MDYLELRVRDVPDREHVERIVREQAEKLERHCDHITSCHVAIERPNMHPTFGARWRVRVEVRLAGCEPFVVRREQGDRRIYDDLSTLIHDAFRAADRKAKELSRQQRGEVKQHLEHTMQGVVQELHAHHGILLSAEGRLIYFHENSVRDVRFHQLAIGMGVAFHEEEGDEGPQASTVRVVDGRAEPSMPHPEIPT